MAGKTLRLEDFPDDCTNCQQCGKELRFDRHYGRRMFCSSECAAANARQLAKDIVREARRGRHCIRCGDEISVERTIQSRYCGTACSKRAGYEKRRNQHSGTCAHCGTPFGGYHRNRRYCSQSCYRAAALPAIRCAECQTEFTPGGPHTFYCGDACQTKARNARARLRAERKAG